MARGTVAEFDERRGLGTITAADGTSYSFHATRIADAAQLGRWEAAAITPC